MKTMISFFICGLFSLAFCSAQINIDEFVRYFKPIETPITNVDQINTNDTLDGKLTNDIIIRKQPEKPKIADSMGKLNEVDDYYGLYPEELDDYTIPKKDENGEWIRMYFNPKVQPIGKINLNDNYYSLIIKVIAYESTFYDLWNFTKDGKALSVLCLFWGKRDAGPRDEKVTFTIVTSEITKEGLIEWHEHLDGHDWYRTYKLNDEGYFQIIKEREEGEYEF